MAREIHPGLRWEVRFQNMATVGFIINVVVLFLFMAGGIYVYTAQNEFGGLIMTVVAALVFIAAAYTFYVVGILHRRWIKRASRLIELTSPKTRLFSLDKFRWHLIGMAGRLDDPSPSPSSDRGEEVVMMSHTYKFLKRIGKEKRAEADVFQDPIGTGLIAVLFPDGTVLWGFEHWKQLFGSCPNT